MNHFKPDGDDARLAPGDVHAVDWSCDLIFPASPHIAVTRVTSVSTLRVQ
jgi:hypothetical protein